MAITRQSGKIVCSGCGNAELIYWLQASNMPRQPEDLPDGWAFEDGNAYCDVDHGAAVEMEVEWTPEPEDLEPPNNGD